MSIRTFTIVFTCLYTTLVFLIVPPYDTITWVADIVGVAGCVVFAQAYGAIINQLYEYEKVYRATAQAGEQEPNGE